MSEQTWTPERLRALRERLGLSLRAAGRQLGVRWTTWFEWEKGSHSPSRLAVMALDALDSNNPEKTGENRCEQTT